MSKDKTELSFLQHLEELRWHLIRSVIAIICFSIIAFLFYNIIFDYILLAPKNADFFTNKLLCYFSQKFNIASLCINNKPLHLININMSGQFNAHIFVSLVSGIILAFPYVFWELWRFVSPALKSNERKHASGAVFVTSLLFLFGILFGYFIIIPFSIHFLGSYSVSSEIINQITLTSYISSIVSITLASGLVFELPIIVYFFAKIGLLSPEFMRKYRKHAIIVILIIAAIITPPDMFSQILVTIPLMLLYEISIFIAVAVYRKE